MVELAQATDAQDYQEPLNQALGHSLSVLDGLQLERGRTPIGTMGNLVQNLSSSEMAEAGGILAQYLSDMLVRKHQQRSLNFLERHLYLEAEKKMNMEWKRRVFNLLAGTTTELVVRVGGNVLGWWLNEQEKMKVARSIYALMEFAGQQEDGTVPPYNQAIMANVLTQLDLRNSQFQELRSQDDWDLRDVNVNFSEPEQKVLARTAYFLLSNNHDRVTTDLERWQGIARTLRLDSSREESFLEEFQSQEDDQRQLLSDHYQGIQSVFAELHNELEVDLSLDLDAVHERARLLASYDPLEERRKRNRKLLKEGGLAALVLGTTAYTGPVADAAIFGGYASSHVLLGDGSGARSELIDQQFAKILNKYDGDLDLDQLRKLRQERNKLKGLLDQSESKDDDS